MSAGSGVMIDSRGYILTNNHVVEEASDINVTFHDGREMSATIVGTDPKSDLAVIKVKVENGPIPSIAWGVYESLRVGDVVLALAVLSAYAIPYLWESSVRLAEAVWVLRNMKILFKRMQPLTPEIPAEPS